MQSGVTSMVEEQYIIHGTETWVSTIKTPIRDDTGNIIGILGIFHDISEKKKTESLIRRFNEELEQKVKIRTKELDESRQKYRNLVENLDEVIFSVDLQGDFTYISPVVERLYGYPSSGMIGQHLSKYVHPDDYSLCIEKFKQHLNGEYKSDEFRILSRTGAIHYVNVSPHPIMGDSSVVGFNYIMTDITNQKKNEAALQEAHKKIYILSSITRHDIVNQVSALRLYLDFSQTFVKDSKILEFINTEIIIADSIGRQIEFTKYYEDIGIVAPLWKNVFELVQTAQSQLQPLEYIEVIIDIPAIQVYADALIEKVFYNLLENSIRHGDHVTWIRFSFQEIEEGAMIIYQDNGIGILNEDKPNLFHKDYGKHTGLGLFLSQEILAITGMTIRENGEPGKGARFEIIVPKEAYRIKNEA